MLINRVLLRGHELRHDHSASSRAIRISSLKNKLLEDNVDKKVSGNGMVAVF